MYINYISIKPEKIKLNYKLFKNNSAGGLKIKRGKQSEKSLEY